MIDPTTTVSIVGAVGAIAYMPAAQEFLKNISGPLSKELGEMAAEPLKKRRTRTDLDERDSWRTDRAAAAITRAAEMVSKAGTDPKAVTPKVLLPLLEGASLEDSDFLTERWAALLANAATPGGAAPVHPRFVEALRQMTSPDARLLEFAGRTGSLDPDEPTGLDFSEEEVQSTVNVLISLGVLEKEGAVRVSPNGGWEAVTDVSRRLIVTSLGRAFLAAVTPPGRRVAG